MKIFKKLTAGLVILMLVLSVGCSGGGTAKGNPVKCSVEIRCDTLLQPGTKLKSGLEKYIPEDGVILKETEVDATDQQSVLEVTRDACKANDIGFVYKGEAYGETGYVQGIDNIFEKDAGKTSGWMYHLDGEALNDPASSAKVKDKSKILWYYVRSYKDKS